MGQTRAVVIPFVVDKNLCFILEAPESAGMHDSRAVALKSGTVRMLFFGVDTPAALCALIGIGRKVSKLGFLDIRAKHFKTPHRFSRSSALGWTWPVLRG